MVGPNGAPGSTRVGPVTTIFVFTSSNWTYKRRLCSSGVCARSSSYSFWLRTSTSCRGLSSKTNAGCSSLESCMSSSESTSCKSGMSSFLGDSSAARQASSIALSEYLDIISITIANCSSPTSGLNCRCSSIKSRISSHHCMRSSGSEI